MMKNRRVWSFVFVVIGALTAAHALAADPEVAVRKPGAALIIQLQAVQTELKLTADQRKVIDELPLQIRRAFKPELEALARLEPAERRSKNTEIRTKFAAEFPKVVSELLTLDQKMRFGQLQLQYRGSGAFQETDVASALEMTEKQRARIEEIQKRTAALREDRMSEILEMLTEPQRTRWRQMIGRPFTFDAGNAETVVERGSRRNIDPRLEVGTREWVNAYIEAWKPTEDERRFRQIRWADDIRDAIRLAKEFNRPVFLFNYQGRIETNRC